MDKTLIPVVSGLQDPTGGVRLKMELVLSLVQTLLQQTFYKSYLGPPQQSARKDQFQPEKSMRSYGQEAELYNCGLPVDDDRDSNLGKCIGLANRHSLDPPVYFGSNTSRTSNISTAPQ